MAFNGSGIFNRLYNWVQDAANGIAITASRMDAETQGIADGLSNCITKDGQSAPSADIPFNNHQLLNVSGITTATTLALPQSQASTLLINNSVSATSNVLDWCAKGSWTATAIGMTLTGAGSYPVNNASFFRIGKMVSIKLTLQWTLHTGVGNLRITGLPYTSANVTSDNSLISGDYSFAPGAGLIPLYSIPANSSYIDFILVNQSTGAITNAPIGASGSVTLTGFYYV
jgi:hypothetical protein